MSKPSSIVQLFIQYTQHRRNLLQACAGVRERRMALAAIIKAQTAAIKGELETVRKLRTALKTAADVINPVVFADVAGISGAVTAEEKEICELLKVADAELAELELVTATVTKTELAADAAAE